MGQNIKRLEAEREFGLCHAIMAYINPTVTNTVNVKSNTQWKFTNLQMQQLQLRN